MHATKIVLASLVVASCSIALAHENDPKGENMEPPYKGSGWREADGGLAGNYDSNKIQLRSWLSVSDLGGGSSSCNDCWGYVSPSGREYAIIGTNQGTAFVEISNPGSADVVAYHSGPTSSWRDIKVFDHYAYAVSEGGSGIQVFDLDNIDSGSVPSPSQVTTGGNQSTHNVAIDTESGYLYRCGGGSNHGLRIYDLNADPANPTFVGEWMERYVHDVQVVTYTDGPYAGMEIAFCCAGFNNGSAETALDVVNVTDKANPSLIRRVEYPGGAYSHQGWLTPDRKYFLLGDELDENSTTPTSVIVIDVENIFSPAYRQHWTNGNTAITHNVYTVGDFAYMANYTSGVRVFDIRDPENMQEVGYFDTYPGSDATSFNGLWSCYPYFPSGTLIGSDMQRGLFVMTPDLRDITFEIAEEPRTIPSIGAMFEFDIDTLVTEVNPSTVKVVYDDGLDTYEVDAQHLGGSSWRVVLGLVTCPSTVSWQFYAEDTEGALYSSDNYSSLVADDFPAVLSDNFETDLGWTVSGSANTVSSGRWMRGWPVGDGLHGDPTTDSDEDEGDRCFVTGNAPGAVDVDGEAILTSPRLDTTGGDAFVSYARWFSNMDGPWPGMDSMLVEISDDDGATWELLEEVGPTGDDADGGWRVVTFRVDEFVEATENVRIRFNARDESPDSNVEAGVDRVAVELIICDSGNPADVNGDGLVDGADLALLLGAWGTNSPEADINNDGLVDGADLAVLLANWT